MNLLDLIFLVVGAIVGYVLSITLKKVPKEKKDKINFVLDVIENFIKANSDWLELPWNKFYKKVTDTLEKTFHFDLTDEEWMQVEEFLHSLYDELRKDLKQDN